MPRRFPLQMLHDLASNRVEAAAQRLALLKQQWQLQEDKLKQLYAFQDEYRHRLTDAVTQGLGMMLMRDFQVFLRKIELAIRQQQSEIDRAKRNWEEGQKAWLEERRKLKTYDVLQQRHVRSEGVREGRVEQREQDEHARNSHSRKSPSEDR
jgi:flagellar FliJ protein